MCYHWVTPAVEKGASASDVAKEIVDPTKYESRHFPLTSLGYGAAGSFEKACNFAHCLCLESGETDLLHKLRHQIRGVTSDQGVESAIAEVGLAVSPVCSVAEWAEGVREAAARDPNEEQLNSGWMLPLSLYMPDHLHIMFGCLERSVFGSEDWADLEKALKTIANFLRNKSVRMRYVARCVQSRQDRQAIECYIGKHTDWKWEYLHQFLHKLRPALRVMLLTFKAHDVLSDAPAVGAAEPELDEFAKMHSLNAKLVHEVELALKVPHLAAKLEVLRAVSLRCDLQAVSCRSSRLPASCSAGAVC